MSLFHISFDRFQRVGGRKGKGQFGKKDDVDDDDDEKGKEIKIKRRIGRERRGRNESREIQ